MNLDISPGEIDVKSDIKSDKIIFNINYPISITENNNTILLKDFPEVSVDSRLGNIYFFVAELVAEQNKYDSLCLSCVYSLATQYNLKVISSPYGDYTIFTVQDLNYKINEKPFEFVFAGRYLE